MSDRLHYHKKHVIEYGQESDFSHQHDAIYDLLVMHGCAVCADNCEDPRYAEAFMVSREDLGHMLGIMNDHDGGKIMFRSRDGELSWNLKEVKEFFQAAYDNSEGELVYFEWF